MNAFLGNCSQYFLLAGLIKFFSIGNGRSLFLVLTFRIHTPANETGMIKIIIKHTGNDYFNHQRLHLTIKRQ